MRPTSKADSDTMTDQSDLPQIQKLSFQLRPWSVPAAKSPCLSATAARISAANPAQDRSFRTIWVPETGFATCKRSIGPVTNGPIWTDLDRNLRSSGAAHLPSTSTSGTATARTAAPPCLPRGLSMGPVCLMKTRHSVAGSVPNETNETHLRYKKYVLSYDQCLIPTLSRYDSAHAVVHSGTKTGHHVSPHRPPPMFMSRPTGPRPISENANAS